MTLEINEYRQNSLIYFEFSKNLDTSLFINKYLILVILVMIGITVIIKNKSIFKRNSLEISEAEIGIGNQKLKIKPNLTDKQIAYSLWIELYTRKLGLEIDTNYDTINEIFKSWYKFFGISRELLKEIPVSKFKNNTTKTIIEVAIKIMNDGMRPHLTKWHAKYNKWYESEIQKECNFEKTPQEIQKKYPQYDELLSELIKQNEKLINYRNILYKIIN